ncbi:hypothetical protein GOP47_0016037 [Adiantum capillus-veneris]|uniref:PORR domain-containing protein n=1 Tax=Adiantum capillus-veneris TaxID=13818 RepID=A0A9D4ULP9_ADICA|nr:hypothetical protein GOP47_0016037 [Adiantum capillus-veneris]
MELGVSVGWERRYGNACCFSARMIAPSSSLSLSFSNTFRNPLLSSPLLCKPFPEQEKQRKLSIAARIEWAKDKHLDEVIQRQKKVRLVTKLKDLLVNEPGMCMSLRELGRYRKKLGLTETRRLVVLIRRYPAIFELFEEGVSNYYYRLTPQAEVLFLEEQKLKAEMENSLVCKIRKLLMMSVDKTLLMFKISHLRRDLGLPDYFRKNLVEKYPEYFKVVELQSGPALELTSWDSELAVSAWERNVEKGTMNTEVRVNPKSRSANRGGRKRHGNFLLKRKDIESIRRFHDMSYFSPYIEFAHINPASREAERHACAVVHEILSMTLEKRLNVDFLTHFRRDYKFSQQVHGMLVRHPELFYVSRKGDRDSVFLREAYRGSELIQKEPLVVLKEKLNMLLAEGEQEFEDRRYATGGVDEADFVDDDDDDEDEDLSVDNGVEGDFDEESKEQGSTLGLDSNGRTPPRRPLVILERERQIAEFVSTAERW